MLYPALYTRPEPNHNVVCLLCPHQCLINPGKKGICRVRSNKDGKLYTETYGSISALHLDPIEKKPLYHFFPGKKILSVGSAGCNLHCLFCQNHEISQCGIDGLPILQHMNSDELLSLAASYDNNIGLAYTYNEPTMLYEFIFDTAKKIHAAGMHNVMVSNGYINREPLQNLIPYIDAFNIDLKAFDDEFYKKITHSTLAPVLETLVYIKEQGKHLEISHLLIPGLNDYPDNFQRMTHWIASVLGKDTILHIARYFPRYKMHIAATPTESIEKFVHEAKKVLKYVYAGNI